MALGDSYHSYNHRQSNPNIRADIERANAGLANLNNEFRSRRAYTKSAPASRATTPTRTLRRDRILSEYNGNHNGVDNGNLINGNGYGKERPLTSASQYSQSTSAYQVLK